MQNQYAIGVPGNLLVDVLKGERLVFRVVFSASREHHGDLSVFGDTSNLLHGGVEVTPLVVNLVK
ncbi:hypothetical protein [Streptomyces lavendofoliae]|uniref:hypothetical protein n=1 Tax=Streptomyces lavendofoliae TaxID=67314 RepID=UPI003D939B53